VIPDTSFRSASQRSHCYCFTKRPLERRRDRTDQIRIRLQRGSECPSPAATGKHDRRGTRPADHQPAVVYNAAQRIARHLYGLCTERHTPAVWRSNTRFQRKRLITTCDRSTRKVSRPAGWAPSFTPSVNDWLTCRSARGRCACHCLVSLVSRTEIIW